MTKLAALAIVLAAAFPIAANAGTPLEQSRAMYKIACKADMKRLCANAEKGTKGACLKEHIKEASPGCRAARKDYRSARKAARTSAPESESGPES